MTYYARCVQLKYLGALYRSTATSGRVWARFGSMAACGDLGEAGGDLEYQVSWIEHPKGVAAGRE